MVRALRDSCGHLRRSVSRCRGGKGVYAGLGRVCGAIQCGGLSHCALLSILSFPRPSATSSRSSTQKSGDNTDPEIQEHPPGPTHVRTLATFPATRVSNQHRCVLPSSVRPSSQWKEKRPEKPLSTGSPSIIAIVFLISNALIVSRIRRRT